MTDITPITKNHIQQPHDIPNVVPQEDWILVREWLRKQKSPNTKRSYKKDIALFYQFVSGKPLQYVTLTDLQDYADTLLYQEKATQAQKLAAVKSLMTFGQKTGKLVFNVGAALQLPKGKDKLSERILEPWQFEKMVEVARQGSVRDYVILMVFYGTGIRCEELCNLRWRDVQTNKYGGQITVLGKRDKTRSIVLHPILWDLLQAYKPDDVKLTDPVFVSRQVSIRENKCSRKLVASSVWAVIHNIAEKAGIKASPHILRHTHATRAIENNVPLLLLMETLGHASLAITTRYIHAKPESSSSMYLFGKPEENI